MGGTKTIVVLGEGTRIVESHLFATTTPGETLSHVLGQLRSWNEASPLEAIGVGSFGPIRVAPEAPDFGTILATPKPTWGNTSVLAPLREHFSCPIGIDTDVSAAALAEHAFGAARDCANMVYITLGTGLGAGVLIDGRPVHGLLHPEIGHIRIRRESGDGFAGTCPFHGDCVEGLISGTALEARLPAHPGSLEPTDPAWDAVGRDLAELLAMLILTLSPQRIVIGGGVTTRQPHLLDRAKAHLPSVLGGYMVDIDEARIADMIRLPALGNDAGPTGALVLAARALVGP
jgi:fructokinase